MYWITLEDTRRFQDGFGLGDEENGFLGPFKVAAHCNVHYLHGGLHLFLADDGEIEKRLKRAQGLIEAITGTIANERRLPLYVAEGTSIAKLRKINSNKYLTYCSDKLRRATGPALSMATRRTRTICTFITRYSILVLSICTSVSINQRRMCLQSRANCH